MKTLILFLTTFITCISVCLIGAANGGVSGESKMDKFKSFSLPNFFLTLQAKPYLTSKTSHFGSNIEGLSVNPLGEIYAVDYGNSTTTNQLGQVFPNQRLFYRDPIVSSKFNGMHFMNDKLAFAVDQNSSRLVKLELNTEKGGSPFIRRSSVHCADPAMIPLNDLAISFKSGLIFLSAMNWVPTSSNKDGEIWVCFPDSSRRPLKLHTMGRVNGIELSPDESILYATEGYTRNWTHIGQKIWKFNVDVNSGRIWNKQLFVDFARLNGDPVRVDLDGLKSDVMGNLLAVRYGSSSVSVFSSSGQPKAKIRLNFKSPTNLELDKVGSNVLFVCGKCIDNEGKGCVDIVDWPWAGRSWLPFTKERNHKNPFLGYFDV